MARTLPPALQGGRGEDASAGRVELLCVGHGRRRECCERRSARAAGADARYARGGGWMGEGEVKLREEASKQSGRAGWEFLRSLFMTQPSFPWPRAPPPAALRRGDTRGTGFCWNRVHGRLPAAATAGAEARDGRVLVLAVCEWVIVIDAARCQDESEHVMSCAWDGGETHLCCAVRALGGRRAE